jgi:hypothetical protein
MLEANRFRAIILLQVLSVPLAVTAALFIPSISDRFVLLGISLVFLLIGGYYFGKKKVNIKDRGPYLLVQLIASLYISIPMVWLYAISHASYAETVRTCYDNLNNGCNITYISATQGDLSPSTVIYVLILYIGVPSVACYSYYFSKKRLYGQKIDKLFL